MTVKSLNRFLEKHKFTQDQSNWIIGRLFSSPVGKAMAEKIQKDFGKCVDEAPATLLKKLSRYKKGLEEGKISLEEILLSGNSVQEVKEKVNALEVQAEMVVIQKQRLYQAMKKEKPLAESGLLLKQVTDQLWLLNAQVKALGEMQNKLTSKKYVGTIENTNAGDSTSSKNTVMFEVTQKVLDAMEVLDAEFSEDED